MTHAKLDLRERLAIEDMLNTKMSVSKIATETDRHHPTIYREIKRNGLEDKELPYLTGYYGVNSQRVATARPARQQEFIRLEGLRAHVRKQLNVGCTPEQIAGRFCKVG